MIKVKKNLRILALSYSFNIHGPSGLMWGLNKVSHLLSNDFPKEKYIQNLIKILIFTIIKSEILFR